MATRKQTDKAPEKAPAKTPATRWFRAKSSGQVFPATEGTQLHKRVTAKRAKHLYEPTTKPRG